MSHLCGTSESSVSKTEALEEESRQRKYMNQETHHTSHHETITHNVDSVQVSFSP